MKRDKIKFGAELTGFPNRLDTGIRDRMHKELGFLSVQRNNQWGHWHLVALTTFFWK